MNDLMEKNGGGLTPVSDALNALNHGRVVEAWTSQDGSAFYRKFSDGWIEQGGISTGFVYSTPNRTTFPREFASTNYVIIGSVVTPDSNNWSRVVYFSEPSRIGVRATTANNGDGGWILTFRWFACGF